MTLVRSQCPELPLCKAWAGGDTEMNQSCCLLSCGALKSQKASLWDQAWTLGGGRAGAESSCPLPVGGNLLEFCNSPSIQGLLLGPSEGLGGIFSFPYTRLELSHHPTSWAERCQPLLPLPLPGVGTEPQKFKCPRWRELGLFCGYQAGATRAVPTQSLLPSLPETWCY